MLALRQAVEVLMADERLAELAVVAVGREHRGLVVAQMAQTVGGQLIAAHGLDQAATSRVPRLISAPFRLDISTPSRKPAAMPTTFLAAAPTSLPIMSPP